MKVVIRCQRCDPLLIDSLKCTIIAHAIVLLIPSPTVASFYITPLYRNISKAIRSTTKASVYHKGSPIYEENRNVLNGLCANIFPELVVVPKSSEDVSKIVVISRYYQVPISVRSGGHSFICASTKPGCYNFSGTVRNVGPAAILGPGSTWDRVLRFIPKDRYTLIHGLCGSVGVGGFILGGGVNVAGTSQRYLNGASNVLQYTLVDTEGRILKVAENNLTQFDPDTEQYHKLSNDYGLFNSLQLAGSSFGIVTEFYYRIFSGAEVLPVVAVVYIDNEWDIQNFEAAGSHGRYHLGLHTFNFFASLDLLSWELLVQNMARAILKGLPLVQSRRRSPMLIVATDNFPIPNQKNTNMDDVYTFLRGFGIKIAVDGKFADFLQRDVLFYDYESLYQTREARLRMGHRSIVSANFQNINNLSSIAQPLLNHPLFGNPFKQEMN